MAIKETFKTIKGKNCTWTFHSYRASMTDVYEYRTELYDKKKNIPYEVHVTVYKRDSGVRDYTIIVQGRVAEEIRGWWMVRTFFHEQGETKTIKSVVEKAEKVIASLGKGLVQISYNEYFDWADNHPIKKHRRVGADWGIYAESKTTSEKGWFDKVYMTIYPKNRFASRFATREEAMVLAKDLAKNNKGWTFEVKQIGKLDS
ncbi:MAG: hypothetical protein IIY21_06155 [Clostridiales bacterium]|nr:hypothetical protein [Clostridiales bacterium]